MSKLVRISVIGLLLFACFVSRIQAQAQATTGVIEGQVIDPGGGVLPGASVTVRNTATGFEQTLRTDNQGRFRAVQLPLGPYRVTVALPGFSTLVRDGLRLEVGATITLPLKLEISTVQQEVKVTAQAPVVEQSRSAGATYIEEKAVNNLPNLQHNFIDFTKLTPGVSTVQGPDGEQLTVNGQKGIQNNVSVDGADFNNPFFGEYRGGQRPAFTFNLDAIQEVVVVADGANAEFGRSSSGFVNVVTKSGTNDFHGSGHVYYKDNNFAARPLDDHGNAKDEFDFDQGQLGATLGGPIKRDSLFYFLAFDGQRARSTKQVDPNRIEPSRPRGVREARQSQRERPDRPQQRRPRLPGQVRLAGLVHSTWSRAATTTPGPTRTTAPSTWTPGGRSANADEKDYSNAGTLSLLSTLSAPLSNELRLQWAREERPRPYNGPIITDGNGLKRPLPDTAFDFAKGYRFGEPFFIPVDYHDTRIQVVDNISYIHGNHYFKAGVEYNDVASSQTFRGFGNGLWKFGSTRAFLDLLSNALPDHTVRTSSSTSSRPAWAG